MRILILLTALLFASCEKPLQELSVPVATEGGWTLASVADVNPARKPEWMQRLGVKQAKTARYAGPIDIEADIYELRSDAAALECTQLWKRAPGDSPFIKRNLFAVVRTSHPNREMLMDFIRALEKAL